MVMRNVFVLQSTSTYFLAMKGTGGHELKAAGFFRTGEG